MKVFLGMIIGVTMAVSMMYECFGVFVLAFGSGFLLWASTQPRLMDDDTKKDTDNDSADASETN